MRILRKSNDTPVLVGQVVYDRKGKRCCVKGRIPNGLMCVTKDNRIVRGSLHEFGCYVEGHSPHNALTPLRLQSFWED